LKDSKTNREKMLKKSAYADAFPRVGRR